MWLTDSELVRGILAGDVSTIAAVYDRHAGRIFRIGFQLMRSEPDAEDLVHDVMVDLPQSVRTFAGTGTFEAWLVRVATRSALMKLREQRSRDDLLQRFGSMLTHAQGPEPGARIDLESAIGRLPDHLRKAFLLREVQGFTHREVASFLGITIGASKVRLHRARALLKHHLRELP